MLSVEGVSKNLLGKRIVSQVDLQQREGEKLAIVGETGSGKSTLMKIIAGLVQPDTGTVQFENKQVLGPDDQLIPGHPSIAYLSQHFELRNNYYVHEILEYANQLTASEATEIFHICQIDHLLQRKTNDGLSGGEKQRIATARLLIHKPKLLLLDEPFSNLDLGHKQMMKSIIQKMSDTLKISIMMVSHDPQDILPWADRILIMKEGAIIQDAIPYDIYHKPMNAYVAGLTGKYNIMPDGSILRPEQMQLTTPDKGGIQGKVLLSGFFGDHYELQIISGYNTYLVYTSMPIPIGSLVCFKEK